ncbi:Glutaminase liver isoform, mitochondrial [Triplophysa tibetana]|uniref:glutaminase n=1 Tax=Triplophysa tibetana TaxID=1572043 RepID=A0A5A9MX33_9TELE|nr:Glutaminase liver isoform, mitochondrial [Triplophysa tibetana]
MSASNGVKQTALEPDKLNPSLPWQNSGRQEALQGYIKKKVAADVLFDSFASGGRVNANQFFEALWSSGIIRTDPRIKDCYSLMRKLQESDGAVDRSTFHRLSLGDWAEPCVLGEISWALIYGLAVDQHGSDYVHRFVGMEEYSKYESPFTLTKQEVTCESGAALAATLANGGLCPLSGDQVLSPPAVRCTLSMMQVAGMNDYSRAFHFRTSVPAKSSQSGVVLIVIPGVLGLMCWSPGLDSNMNSCRGVHFCEELVSTFQLHSFDIETSFRQTLSYRQWKVESEGYQIMNVLLAAYRGDVVSLRRYLLSGADANAVDYDGRSALHVAASEGHLDIIKFLVENACANCTLKDRWGNTALQEAVRCNQDPAIQFLRKYTDC